MCGIVGQFTYNFPGDKNDPRVKAIVQRMLLSESLVHMEPRGKDSTGIALLWSDRQTAVLKQPIPVSEWARDDGMWGEDYENPDDKEAHFSWLVKTWMRGLPDVIVKQALGHVRKKTVGSEYNVHNNHPILIRPDGVEQGSIGDGTDLLVGVHNGGVNNDDALFKKYDFKRIGQVDSEVIFQMMYKYKDDISVENLQETFKELRGVFATMAFNPQNPDIVGCMRDVRPLDGVYIPQIGTVMLISERKFLDAALETYDRWRVRDADTVMSVLDEDGNEHVLGKVDDVFPYLTCDWYNTIPTGVFVLDLNTEVTDKTKVKDLVKVTNVTKPAVGNTTHHHGHHCGYNSQDNRSASGSTGTTNTTSKPTQASTVAGGKIGDTTEVQDLSPYNNNTDTDTDTDSTDDVDIEINLNEDDVQEVLDDGCPYTWDERLNWALEALYEADAEGDNRLLISRLNELNMKDVLSKFLIEVNDEDRAKVEFASYYDAIFPEGFALGVQHGYSLAADEYDATAAEDDERDVELQDRVDELELALKAKDKALKKISERLQAIELRRQRAATQLATIGPVYRYFLRMNDVMDSKTRKPDKAKLTELYERARASNKRYARSISSQITE